MEAMCLMYGYSKPTLRIKSRIAGGVVFPQDMPVVGLLL